MRSYMHLFRETFLLFLLNILDAILTIVWVRSGVATEGNHLMAKLLDMGDFTFLGAKIAIGTFAALVLLRWGNHKVAKYGVAVALVVYVSVMGIHLLTYLSAVGYMASVHDLSAIAELTMVAL
jgi:hypothetical protein